MNDRPAQFSASARAEADRRMLIGAWALLAAHHGIVFARTDREAGW